MELVKEKEKLYMKGFDSRFKVRVDLKAILKPLFVPKDLNELRNKLPESNYDSKLSSTCDDTKYDQEEEKTGFNIVSSGKTLPRKNAILKTRIRALHNKSSPEILTGDDMLDGILMGNQKNIEVVQRYSFYIYAFDLDS